MRAAPDFGRQNIMNKPCGFVLGPVTISRLFIRLMNRVLIFVILLASLPVDAQMTRNGRIIVWNDGTAQPDPHPAYSQGRRHLHFDGKKSGEAAAYLPVFSELLFEPEYYPGHIVALTDMSFEPLTERELATTGNTGSIDSEIELHQEWSRTRGEPALSISFVPVRRNPVTGSIEKLVSFSYSFAPSDAPLKSTEEIAGQPYPDNSVLSAGTWVMVKTTEDGIYRLTYSDLVEMGIQNPGNVRVFGNGNRMLPKMNSEPVINDLVENRIYMSTGSNGVFSQGDFILFYGQGPVAWNYNQSAGIFEHEPHLYSDGSYYFITSSSGGKGRIETRNPPSQQAGIIVEEFDDYLFHQERLVNLIGSGREWRGELFRTVTTRTFSFTFPNLKTDREVRLKWKATARAPVSSSFTASFNSAPLSHINFSRVIFGNNTTAYADENEGTAAFAATGDRIDLSVRYNQNTPSAEGWLDYLLLNARRSLTMTGTQMHFRDRLSAGDGRVAEFRISNTPSAARIWDITDPSDISGISTSLSGTTTIFRDRTDRLQQYVAFNGDSYLKPVIVGRVQNQNLHGIRRADMIIVAPPLFMPAAARLAEHRRNSDGLQVITVTPEQIYNEFSSGKPDVTAIRNFVRMLYERAAHESEMPRYLLLFGKGTYDNRPGDPSGINFVPTFQSGNSVHPIRSFVSDDFFGLLDKDEGEPGGSNAVLQGLLDIGIGRLPVTTADQAHAAVNKIIGYESNMDDWQNVLCFIGDDGDNNLHMNQADILAERLRAGYPAYNIEKIYLDAWPKIGTSVGQRYPGVNNAINERIRKGALVINYIGHGNDRMLADENIIDVNDVLSWKNRDRLPVFMTATCDFSRFDNPSRVSAGEWLFLNPGGGAIALFSTTRLVYAYENFLLNQNFNRFILERYHNGYEMRLGDVMRLTKINTPGTLNKRNFVLLGDPSMKLAIPEFRIEFTSVNETPVNNPLDTLKALSRVTISGIVTDRQNNKLDDFNGLVHHTVFDKVNQIYTLGNNGSVPFSFESRNNIIYKGKASATGGTFTFSFIVPKDIAYHYGHGKFSSFASDGQSAASGYFKDIIVGGSNPDAAEDNEGPDIELFMNDRNFVSGGLTDQNPRLLAFLTDSSGINTVGTGIGHDITLTLNDDPHNIIVLNEYYSADADSYQRGTIEYPLSGLEEGNYNLRLKAWDVHNNSSEASLDFTVSESSELAMKHVFNYPNPFTGHTSFHFEHNRQDTGIDVLIQVFTVTGRLVKTLQSSVNGGGFKPDPIPWDGLDDYGDRIGRGVYIYRIRLRTADGQSAEKYERLVILK